MNARLVISDQVRGGLAARRPVVALETSVVAQGLPPPRNLEAARTMAGAVESRGGVPAWTCVLDGSVRVGVGAGDLERLVADPATVKVARRDLAVAAALGVPGATTVSATAWAAARAGIRVAATGGIGGVHPGTGDVSADLAELSRTPIVLVSSGPKSILDPEATLERLDELGVAVVGYGTDRLPFFVVRDSELALEHRVDDAAGAAEVVRAALDLEMPSAILLCVPCPEEAALPPSQVRDAVRRCAEEAKAAGVRGAALTPHLLDCLRRITDGASLEANLALLEANAAVAADVAAALGG
jgi:pseudouridine-5'-phosphate glycosidase